MSETFNLQANVRIAETVRRSEARFTTDGSFNGSDRGPYFAKITELAKKENEDDNPKRAKGVQFYYDSDSFKKTAVVDGWIFDDDSESDLRTGDIYSDSDMKVNDIVEVFRYNDKTATGNQMEWLVRSGGGGGGAERPTVITQGTLHPFGATLTSPTDFTPLTVFEAGQASFIATLPWSGYGGAEYSVSLPDDFSFTGDPVTVEGVTTYFANAYPSTVWAKSNSAYSAGGITIFDILESRSDTAAILNRPTGAKLILQGYIGGSTASNEYFIGKYFACSFNFVDGNFYFDHPVF